ncbi:MULTISPECIES: hypothetical protein [Carboxydocella]|uniref:Uncharacterized protein n=2 Tax=Carboxydocella TaxID=178898 RepID=A0A1T4QP57_9FIRM|nr:MULTISPECIES: hypothetical protein [Carboxydocella]AVX21568.1 hypothetical protein CFE_2425 [Carboxydocella thermautotrophica]AVX32049.1 hypothetical protein CTH_2510 [Carboxydocella thermautotrophica]SKA05038.1 hypothetical protein SAMN02745885_01723 [Carboxydocella sporoproducens DSM 16521]GAW27718.1 hypothetical protein ULO1_02880 [Carboxydocella sp. ULO1]GAW31911.1 hypothetical protein JDF658_16760 [Carboxydocella sp. JDF658]
MRRDLFARHGGVHFTANVSPHEINTFIRELPAEKRDNLFEVLSELDAKGLITIHNDGVFTDGVGNISAEDQEC